MEVCRGSTGYSIGRSERGFLGIDGGKMVGKLKWKLDKDVKGSRTWLMKLRID